MVYPDGNVAWESMAAERGFGVEAVSHQRKQFTRKIVQNCSQLYPSLAGTQIIDRAWSSLKNDWWPQHVNATSKVAGHTLMSEDVKAMVNQWVFRQSLGPITPIAFLEELKRLLKQLGKKGYEVLLGSSLEQGKNQERQKTLSFFLKIPFRATAVYQAWTQFDISTINQSEIGVMNQLS